MIADLKKCKKCQIHKVIEEFHKHVNKNGTTIYSSQCAGCRREIARTWNKVNRKKHAAHQAKWRKTHQIRRIKI